MLWIRPWDTIWIHAQYKTLFQHGWYMVSANLKDDVILLLIELIRTNVCTELSTGFKSTYLTSEL